MKKNVILHAFACISCFACAILLCAMQTTLIPRYINDALLVPDLILCMTVALGMLAGPVYGSLFGIFAGMLADATAGFGIFLLPLFYMLCAYGAYVCADILPRHKFPVYLAYGTFCALFRSVVAVIYVCLSVDSIQLLGVLRYVSLPLLLGTVFALPLLYLASLALTLPKRKIKHQNIDKLT